MREVSDSLAVQRRKGKRFVFLTGIGLLLTAWLSVAPAAVVDYTYHYDAAGRLIRATGNGKVIRYAYDSAGNGTRLTITGFGTGDLSYGGSLTLKEAILILQVAAGLKPDLSSVNLLAEVSGDGKLGREEALYILQTLAGMR
jgi:YD repeat-containing protein